MDGVHHGTPRRRPELREDFERRDHLFVRVRVELLQPRSHQFEFDLPRGKRCDPRAVNHVRFTGEPSGIPSSGGAQGTLGDGGSPGCPVNGGSGQGRGPGAGVARPGAGGGRVGVWPQFQQQRVQVMGLLQAGRAGDPEGLSGLTEPDEQVPVTGLYLRGLVVFQGFSARS